MKLIRIIRNILIGVVLMMGMNSCGTMHVVEGPPPDNYMYHYYYQNYWPRYNYVRPPMYIRPVAPPPKPKPNTPRPTNRPNNNNHRK